MRLERLSFFVPEMTARNFLYLSFSIFFSCSCSLIDGRAIAAEIDKNASESEIVAAFPRHFPPLYDFDNAGKPIGYAIEVMDAMARRAGLKIRYVDYPNWDAVSDALNSGKADLIPNSGISPQRRNQWDYTNPISDFDINFFVLAERSDLVDWKSLEGKMIGVSGSNVAVKLLEEKGVFKLKKYESYDESLMALFRGNIDAIVHPTPVALRKAYEVGLIDRMRKIDPPIMNVKRAIAVHFWHKELIPIFNSIIPEFLNSQEHKEIYDRWYGWSIPFWTLQRVLVGAGILILIISGSLIFWRFHGLRQANREMHENNELLKILFKSSQDLIYVKDKNLNFRRINMGCERFVGVSDREIHGKSDADIFTLNSSAKINEIDRRVLGGEIVRDTYEINRLGNIRTFEVVKEPIRDQEGKVVGLCGVSRDVTDRNATELALRKTQGYLKAVIDHVPAIIYLKDLEGRLILSNRAHLEHHGVEFGELEGKTSFEYDSPRVAEENYREEKEVIDKQEPVSYEKVRFLSDGSERIFLTTRFPVFDEGENLIGVGGLNLDISDRVKAEKIIKSEKNRSELYLEISGSIIVALDTAGKIILVNKKAEEVLGMSNEDLVGQDWFEITLPEDQREEVRGVHRQVVEGNLELVEYYENDIVSRNGVRRTIAWHNSIARDENGEIIGLISSGEDITDRLKLEETLRHTQRLEAIGQLTGGVAHDFNNLLQVIETNLELLKDRMPEDADEISKDLIEGAMNAGRRGASLTNQILAFSRKQSLSPQIVEAKVLIDGVTKVLTRTLGEDITVEISISDDLGTIKIDESGFYNAVLNIGINSRHAMPNGGTFRISTDRVEFDKVISIVGEDLNPGTYIEIALADTGCGMPEEAVKKAFEPFFTTRDVGKGSGLGLSMVFGFCRQSGGAVSIKSKEGEGTTVRMLFPLADN